MAFVFKLVCCFNCSFLLLLLCGRGMLWAGEVALGHSWFQVFCQRRRKGPDSLDRTCCYSNFALTMVFEIPSSGRRVRGQLWCGRKHECNIQGWSVQVSGIFPLLNHGKVTPVRAVLGCADAFVSLRGHSRAPASRHCLGEW